MERTLSDSEKDEIAALYNRRYQKKGRDISTVGWGSVKSQLLRFEMVTRGLELNGKAILDIGCGLGDFITFLRKKTNTFRYTGIDIATGELVVFDKESGVALVDVCNDLLLETTK